MTKLTKLTILNDIVDQDFEKSLEIQKSWGIQILDLRNVYGKSIIGLSNEEAELAAKAVKLKGMEVYCLSFGLMYGDIEMGEQKFRERYMPLISRAIEIARILQPKVVRLLSAHSTKRTEFEDSMEYIGKYHPWVIPVYQEAVDQIAEAGLKSTIENEVKGNILATPNEILDFFSLLNRPGKVSFTFDVQNLWLMGTFPTIEVYSKLRPLIQYYHLKGGMSDGNDAVLKWQSTLEDAGWPVIEITKQLVEDGLCDAICLNPSHGEMKENYNYDDVHAKNVEYLRNMIPQLSVSV